ncbi:MAG: pilus (MSHA type) biogenesis protein MshL, partial [Gammaproteobacteria bacterium]|nr:pilus (MSHA type) biogenesis protein MshL [Gammaproteobacteria bacterium]
MKIRGLLAGIISITLLYGCASNPAGMSALEDPITGALTEAAQEAPPPPPLAVTDALLPPPDTLIDAGQPAKERFDVNVTNSDAKAFFSGLVEGTRTNLVVHPDVRGKISLHMKSVTIGEVLNTVQEVYGYEVRSTPNGYVVMPASMQTRIFQVDYLDMQRSGVSRMRVSSGQVSERSRGRDNNTFESTGNNQENTTGDGQSVTGSRIDTSYSVDFWADLEQGLSMIVGTGADRRVVVNSQTGVIMVRAMPEQLRSVEGYLQKIQATAQRQVLLEAKIIEVELSDNFQAGINWVSVAQTSRGNNFAIGQSAPPGNNGFRVDSRTLGGAPITVAPGVQYTGFDNLSLGGAFTLAFDIGDFNAFIELLEAQGNTRVLSSPRVATLNNQKAVIKAGTDEFFVTDVSSNTVTGTSSTTSRDVELTPFFSGIALDVTPQISADGVVTLHIHPTVSDVTDQQKDLTVSGETDRLPLAFSEVRESDTVVRARSGQIIVIGGLMRDSRREQDFGTPILGKLPGVGALFRSKSTVSRKSELVILLKPIVVDQDQAWSAAAR